MGNGFPYICRKWQLNLVTAFRANGNPCVLPINVFQIQGHDCTSTQTEPGQEKQNRIIPASDGSPPLIALQHFSYAAGGEELGQSRKKATGGRGHTNRPNGPAFSLGLQLTHKRAKSRNQEL